MKIATIVGARPQFIKAAAVSRELSNHSELKEIIIHTGQHFDQNMSDIFFNEMQIPQPHYQLAVSGGSHGKSTGRMLEKIEEVLLLEKPDAVLVYGDTNSTLAGALAAKKIHIPLVHVEAGLRSFNMRMPEELNRILTDRISDLLCCPTDEAVKNLEKEGFNNFASHIRKTGDVMYDVALFYQSNSTPSTQIQELCEESSPFILATIHRAENTDNIENLQSIFEAFNEINTQTSVILPLHPRTRKIVEQNDIPVSFKLIDPVGYFDMIHLIQKAALVMTDSGGLQKEAFFFKKNCVTLREQTEWTELVENGLNVLTGADKSKILSAYKHMLHKSSNFDINLYGKGNASAQIVKAIQQTILSY
ncbi:non-hydrolyzing UDP-N-acetylglucosamine 2-epimerase [Nafulsella turpanensis]|uniref:non-hydrolyzing UDP-N-acetylglucosamine 2-epimerase n=1 Tax=Nafulsella turpanensis TaxID=1265690 RepID=UPI000346CEA0|nr:UDP-N-acetylglucosamine 2-epimerase (non-hydrolyzing) [Nafulsella turpanensis]